MLLKGETDGQEALELGSIDVTIAINVTWFLRTREIILLRGELSGQILPCRFQIAYVRFAKLSEAAWDEVKGSSQSCGERWVRTPACQ